MLCSPPMTALAAMVSHAAFPRALGRLGRLWTWVSVQGVLAVALQGTPALAADGQRPAVGERWTAHVRYVVDGDSIWVRPESGGTLVKLRLEGIDAPEVCQDGGAEARVALTELVRGQRLRVTVWAHDAYGRAIATVNRTSDELDVPRAMVRQGWAWSDAYHRVLGKYWREEADARHERKGVFAEAWPEPPAEFRRRHGPCSSGQVGR